MLAKEPLTRLEHVYPPTSENVQATVRQNMERFVDNGIIKDSRNVVIKVNLNKPFPADSGSTTDVRITKEVVKWLLEVNPSIQINIVESDTARRSAEEVFDATGHSELQARYPQVHLVNLSKGKYERVFDRRLRYLKAGLILPSIFLDCDYFISISKLKTHEAEKCTGILKNQLGCMRAKRKDRFHPYMSDLLADINTVLKPDFSIIDGLVAMEGAGPSYGTPKRMNVLIFGSDPVLTDSVAATLMGLTPRAVPILKKAANRGLGVIDIDTSNVQGASLDELKSTFRMVPRMSFILHRMSFKVYMFADVLTSTFKMVASIGQTFERLSRALYFNTIRTIFIIKLPTLITRKIKTPSVFIKLAVNARLRISSKEKS